MHAAAILEAREQRGWAIEALGRAWGRSVLSVTLNIPGGKKNDPAYAWIGFLALEEIKGRLDEDLLLEERFRRTPDGPEGLLAVAMKPEALKAIAREVEDTHPLGRLFDLDVAGQSRDFGKGKRPCMLCGANAAACRRENRHSLEDLLVHIDGRIEAWKRGLALRTAKTAAEAMREEVDATPKPGLVDRANSGAHRDMDRSTFLAAIEAIEPFFLEMGNAAVSWTGSPGTLFKVLRPIGLRAEAAMLEATKGVNTHKGQIFSMGLAVAAWCRLARTGRADASGVSAEMAEMARGIAGRELKRENPGQSHGERAYAAYGVKGARGEAEKGFPTAFTVGLPVFKQALASGLDRNGAAVWALLAIMAELEDSNLYKRGGPAAARWVRTKALQLSKASSVFSDPALEAVRAFDREMIRRNLSPGGAADLLALSIFVEKLGL